MLDSLRSIKQPRGFSVILIIAASIPAALVIAGMASDILKGTRFFGSNPIKEGEHFIGRWTLRLLIATLAVTPLRQLTGWNWLAKHRRTLGLFAFGYLTLHWLTYVLLDVQLDWADLTKDLLKRPYIYIGMTGLLLMIPLAITSTKNSIRRLGGKKWNRLHQITYIVPILGLTHFAMAVKKDESGPLVYALCFAALYAWRIWRWWRMREVPGAAAAAAAAPAA